MLDRILKSLSLHLRHQDLSDYKHTVFDSRMLRQVLIGE